MLQNDDIEKHNEFDMTNSFSVASDDISLLDYWLLFLELKWSVLLIITACIFVGVLIAFLSMPLYRAEVLVTPISDGGNRGIASLNGQFGELASLAGVSIPISSGRKIDEAVAVLRSREFTYHFFKDQNILPELFKKRWDAKLSSWGKGKKIPTFWDAYKLFDKKIRKINIDKKTRHVTLTITWEDPSLSTKWANTIIKRLNKKLRDQAIKQSNNNLSFLQKELSRTSVLELKKSIYNLMEVEMKKSMIANSGKEYIFHVIDKAVIPEEKISPRRGMIIFISIIIGFFLAIIFVIIKSIYGIKKTEVG